MPLEIIRTKTSKGGGEVNQSAQVNRPHYSRVSETHLQHLHLGSYVHSYHSLEQTWMGEYQIFTLSFNENSDSACLYLRHKQNIPKCSQTWVKTLHQNTRTRFSRECICRKISNHAKKHAKELARNLLATDRREVSYANADICVSKLTIPTLIALDTVEMPFVMSVSISLAMVKLFSLRIIRKSQAL